MLRPSNSIRWILPVLVVLSLAGCSRDPNVRKAKFLSSGMDYARTGKYAEAVVQFHNAIDIDPKLAPAHFELARAYLHLNAGTEAIREFQQGLVLDPANSQAKLELAPLLVALKQYDQAEALVHEVLTADPKNERAHAILGQRYSKPRIFPAPSMKLRRQSSWNHASNIMPRSARCIWRPVSLRMPKTITRARLRSHRNRSRRTFL